MKVLVTGHTSYIGAVLVPMLRPAGRDVKPEDTPMTPLEREYERMSQLQSERIV